MEKYTSRIEKSEIKEKQEDLKKVLFDEKEKKPKFTSFMVNLTLLITIALSIYLIIDSNNKINQIYQIINASLILIIVLCFVSSYRQLYYNKKTKMTSVTSPEFLTCRFFKCPFYL